MINDLGLSIIQKKYVLNEFFVLTAEEKCDSNGTVLVSFKDVDIKLYAMMLSSKGINISADKGDRLVCKFSEDQYSLFYIGNLGTDSDLKNLSDISDLSDSFILKLGENLIFGNKDGSKFVIQTGDGELTITHTSSSTDVEASGFLTVTADNIAINKALAGALNAMTIDPYTKAPLVSTVPTVTLG